MLCSRQLIKNRIKSTFIFIFLLFKCSPPLLDSLLSKFNNENDGIERINTSLDLALEYANKEDYQNALRFAETSQHLAEQFNDSLYILKSYRIKSQLLRRLDRTEEALKFLLKIQPIAKRNMLSDKSYQGEYELILNAIGIIYAFQAKYDRALEYHFECLEIRNKDNNRPYISVTLNNIGLVYFMLKDFKKALRFYEQALELKKRIHYTYDLDRLLINIGLCYNQLQDFSKALTYFEMGLKECDGNCSEQIKAEGKFGLGMAYFTSGNLVHAKQYFTDSYSIAKNSGNKRFQAENLLFLARIHIQEKNKKFVLILLRKTEQIAASSGYDEILMDTYNEFFKFYDQLNDYKRTSFYQNKYIQLKDSIYSEELTQNLMVAQAEYEQRENKAQIASQKETLLLKERVISRQNWINILAYITVALMITLVFLLYRSNVQKKRINKLLEQKVKERTLELEQSYAALQQTHQEQTRLVSKTSNDIRSPLATMKGLCSLALKELTDTEAQKYLDEMNATTEQISDLIGRLSLM